MCQIYIFFLNYIIYYITTFKDVAKCGGVTISHRCRVLQLNAGIYGCKNEMTDITLKKSLIIKNLLVG